MSSRSNSVAGLSSSNNHYHASNPDDEKESLLGGEGSTTSVYIPGSYSAFNAFRIFFFPALGGLLFGYDIGATSSVVSQLEDSDYAGVEWYSVVANSSLLQGVITSMMMGGALLGSLTCFKVADALGRRRSLLLGSMLYFVGAVIEYISGNSSWDAAWGITVLLIGRAVYGYACGFAMHGAPAYIGEMAPPDIRGFLVSMKEVFIVLGMVLGYSVGYAYSTTAGGWASVYGWATPVALGMGMGMYFLPFSARWLALQGRINEAKASLRFVIPELPMAEIEAIRDLAVKAAQQRADAELRGGGFAEDWRMFMSPGIYPALVAGVGLVIFQQITGQPSVLYYAVTIFEDIGLDTSASIIIALFKLVATSITTFTVDKYGRKLLLQVGCTSMFIALIILTISFMFTYMSEDECNTITSSSSCSSYSSCSWSDDDCACSDDTDDCTCCGSEFTAQKVVIMLSLFLYIGGYQIGYGPISWLMISEIFPLEVRGKAVSIAVVMNFFWNMTMTLIFPSELEYFGASLTFGIYALIMMSGLYFLHTSVPETKGMTLEEIEAYFLASSNVGDTNLARSTTANQRERSESVKSTASGGSGYQSFNDTTRRKNNDPML